MVQKTLSEYVVAGKKQEEKKKQEIRQLLYHQIARNTIIEKCPLCAIELPSIPIYTSYKYYQMDSYLIHYRIINGCTACHKLFITPKTLGDVWREIFNAPLVKQALEEEERKKGIKCPLCQKYIHLEQIPKQDWIASDKGIYVQCYHCSQLLLIKKEVLEKSYKVEG